eukprot:Seg2112.4 transcript_id=Seg2112.4/GoldUCD/mRNA.D3Y31 product="hypothetical protein" protein_id=Seg2112.4/GoldUCD/D3Y31
MKTQAAKYIPSSKLPAIHKNALKSEEDGGLTLQELTYACIWPEEETLSITDSLKNLQVSGNITDLALALATKDEKAYTSSNLPRINIRGSRISQNRSRNLTRKVSFDTKCPIVKSLRQAQERQHERERYWKRHKVKLTQPVNAPNRGSKKILPKLGHDALFQHLRQKYDDYEAQENVKMVRKKALKRIAKNGRLSMAM